MPELCDAQSSPTQVELHPINLELDTDANVSYLQQIKRALSKSLQQQYSCMPKTQTKQGSTHRSTAPVVVQFAPTAACVMFTKLQPVMLKIAVPPICKKESIV